MPESMMRALVVDDEPGAREDLVRVLRRDADVDLVGAVGNVADAAELVRRHRPEVVFLDVRLDGESGFRLLRETDTPYDVIFVTAHDEYALRAFEVNALDYLLKPVEPQRLRSALARIRRRNTAGVSAGDSGSEAERELRYDDWLFLRLDQGRRFLKVSEISHVTAEGDYTAVHTTEGERHLVLRPLHRWEARLPEPQFLRIHRSTVVNLERVERVEPWSNYTFHVHLRGVPEALTMSRSYAKRAERVLG